MRIGLRAARLQAGILQQMLAHQVRHIARHARNTDVDIGFAEINGQQLRVAIGHVQDMHIARFGHVVKLSGFLGAGLAT